MKHYEFLLITLSLAAYLVTAVLYLRQLFGTRQFWGRRTVALLVTGLTLHFAALLAHGATGQVSRLPVENLLETLSFAAWCLVLVFVFAETRWKLTALGAFALPLALVALAGSFILLRRPATTPALIAGLNPTWLGVHVTLVIIGYAAFALAACSAGAYLIQDSLLKRKRLMGVSRQLPPVQVADEAAYRLAALGFPVFTLGLVIGVIWAFTTQPQGWLWDPKVIWSLVTWLVFVVYLHARMANGWKGRKAAALLIIGFSCAIITFVLTGFLRTGWHHFV